MKKALLFLFLGIVFLWIVGIVLENAFDVDLDRYFSGSPATPKAVAGPAAVSSPSADSDYSNWKTYKNDDFHLSILSPYQFYETTSNEPTTVKSLTARGHSDDMKFIIEVFGYEMPNANLDINHSMEKQIEGLKQMDKLFVNLQMSSSPITVADTPGVLAVGTYQIMGKLNFEMQILKVKKGTALIDVSAQYQSTDDNKAKADKIIRSLSFTN